MGHEECVTSTYGVGTDVVVLCRMLSRCHGTGSGMALQHSGSMCGCCSCVVPCCVLFVANGNCDIFVVLDCAVYMFFLSGWGRAELSQDFAACRVAGSFQAGIVSDADGGRSVGEMGCGTWSDSRRNACYEDCHVR